MDNGTNFMLQRARELLRETPESNPMEVLDIGPGTGGAMRAFSEDGHKATGIGLCTASYGCVEGVIEADYNTYDLGVDRFDAVWASHVLEHQLNTHHFLSKALRELKPLGWLFLVVPPLKQQIVGGHLNLFNEGLLVYNVIMAGFDCSEALVSRRGYNIACFVRKPAVPLQLPPLRMDCGDIEKLAAFFPCPVRQGFNGEELRRW